MQIKKTDYACLLSWRGYTGKRCPLRQRMKSRQRCAPIDKIFTLEQIADAQRYMESNGQVGKIVVKV